MRNIKTGIAVTLSVLLGNLGIVSESIFTTSACIMSMKNTVKSSFSHGMQRVWGTILGGIFGYLAIKLFKGNYFYTGIGVIAVIHLCILLNINDAITITVLTFASIVIGSEVDTPFMYSVSRVYDTLVGVLIAVMVNFSLSRKKYLELLYAQFQDLQEQYISLVKQIVSDRKFDDLDLLNELLFKLEEKYISFLDEITYSTRTGNPSDMKSVLAMSKQIKNVYVVIHLLTHS